MKVKFLSKSLTSLLAFTLIFSSTTFANTKTVVKGKSEVKQVTQMRQQQVEKKSNKIAKVKAKKIEIKSSIGKSVQKNITSAESNITKITQAINLYFGVKADGTTDKELTKKIASDKYNSYKGKLNAEINKLRAIDKQIAAFKRKYKASASEFDALAAKSKELQKLASDESARVKTLATEASTTTTPTGGTTTTAPTTTPTDGTTTTTTTTPTDGTTTTSGNAASDTTVPTAPSDATTQPTVSSDTTAPTA